MLTGPSRHLATALVLLLATLPACGDVRDPLPDRYARRFLPFDPAWIPEAEVPSEPQTSPLMVIWEFTETLDEPGPEEHAAADAWVERCYDAAKRHRWYDYEKGVADGFVRPLNDPRHYQNVDHMLDGVVLDPDRPEYLMYYPKEDGTQGLAGLMFITNRTGERGPQFAGGLTLWHHHVWTHPRCMTQDLIPVGFARRGEKCAKGEARHRSTEMIHTWLIDHPKGPFATSMFLPPEAVVEGLEKRMRERGF